MICPEFVAYFKTGYTGGLRGQGPQRHRVEVTFPIELWNKNQQTCDSVPRTILYKTVTTQHKTQLQICILIFGNWTSLIEEILGKKKKNDAKQGDRLMNKQKQYQFSSVAQSCPTLCDPMNHSTPGLPVHHQLPEFTQTHVRRVGDAIQPSHSLSSPSPPAPNPSQQ